MKQLKYLLTLTLGLLLFSCAQPFNGNDDEEIEDTTKILVNKVGADESFEIMTWNIEHFPIPNDNDVNISRTVSNVQTIIKNLDVDLIAVQEIENTTKFKEMIDDMDGWSGILNSYPDAYSSYQHTGIIYKNDMISVENPGYILENELYDFALRPPFSAFVKVKNDTNGVAFDFNLIVLHLKAYADSTSESRRRKACNDLEEYISDEINAGTDKDFIVLGDWNDELDDPTTDNVFNVFLDKSDEYTFLTNGLDGQYSYASYSSLIDHIMITANAEAEYGSGTTQVLYLDQQFSSYYNEVSDHRPVMAKFDGFSIKTN